MIERTRSLRTHRTSKSGTSEGMRALCRPACSVSHHSMASSRMPYRRCSQLANYQASVEQLNALQRAHASAIESADNVNRMFVGGRATYLDELDASHTLTANDLGLTESKVTVAMSQVDLFEALGGGREAGSDMISPITSR